VYSIVNKPTYVAKIPRMLSDTFRIAKIQKNNDIKT